MTMGVERLSCRKVRRRMQSAVDDETGAGGPPELRAHLAECGPCRMEYQRLLALVETLSTDPVPELSANEWQALVRDAEEHLSLRPGRTYRRALLPAAAVLCLIVAGLAASFFASPRWALASTLLALQRVETAHGTGQGEDLEPYEMWYAEGRGLRDESPRRLVIFTPTETMRFDRRRQVAAYGPPATKEIRSQVRLLVGTSFLTAFKPGIEVQKERTQLNGRPANLIHVTGQGRAFRMWADPETDLVFHMELQLDDEKEPKAWLDIEYGIEIPDETFEWDPPEGVRVVDVREWPFADIWEKAKQSLIHEVHLGRSVTVEGLGLFTSVNESWAQYGVGKRSESAPGCVQVSTADDGVTIDPDGTTGPRSRKGASATQLVAHSTLSLLARGEVDDFEDVSLEETVVNGRRVLQFSFEREEYVGGWSDRAEPHHEGRRFRNVFRFDMDNKHLLEWRRYVWFDDEWRWVETTVYDYPEAVPDDVFALAHDWSRPTSPIWDEARAQQYRERYGVPAESIAGRWLCSSSRFQTGEWEKLRIYLRLHTGTGAAFFDDVQIGDLKVQNPSFEEADGHDIVGWHQDNVGETIFHDIGGAAVGSGCVCIRQDESAMSRIWQDIDCEPNTWYRVSVSMRQSGLQGDAYAEIHGVIDGQLHTIPWISGHLTGAEDAPPQRFVLLPNSGREAQDVGSQDD